MYIKLNNGQIEKYPYTSNDLRSDNPQTSFPERITDELFAEFGALPVQSTACPQVDYTQKVTEGTPVFDGTAWKQVWETTQTSYEEQLAYILSMRAAKYPPMSDYLDGLVKGDQAQIDKYIADCLAVKAQYPKPLPPG